VITVTFSSPSPPKEIRAGYLVVKVDTYIPNPLRCFNCQQFGHHQSVCRRSKVCPKCSGPDHGDDQCTGTVKCPNCTGSHPAYTSTCPKWVQEKEICRLKVEKNISFPEARKLVQQTQIGTDTSVNQLYYSAAVKGHTRTIATQTDCNCRCDCQPVVVGTHAQNQSTSSTQTDNTNPITEAPVNSTMAVTNSTDRSQKASRDNQKGGDKPRDPTPPKGGQQRPHRISVPDRGQNTKSAASVGETDSTTRTSGQQPEESRRNVLSDVTDSNESKKGHKVALTPIIYNNG